MCSKPRPGIDDTGSKIKLMLPQFHLCVHAGEYQMAPVKLTGTNRVESFIVDPQKRIPALRFFPNPGCKRLLNLLLFGAGLAAGNLLGGKLADRGVVRALVLTIAALMAVLAAGRWAFGHSALAMGYVVLLGTVAFATVAPMQMRVLQQAGAAGANLASSLNISAFNLGNALGAWVGGLVLSHGFGLLALGGAAAEPEI